jgi:hypothetical protein
MSGVIVFTHLAFTCSGDAELTLSAELAERTLVTIATQRSGTKAFAQSLNTGALVRSVYEVFLPKNKPASLTRSFVEHLGANPDFSFAPDELTAFLDTFFAGLHAKSDREYLHCDVMYDNLGVLSTLWTYPIGLPYRNFLLGYMRSRRFLVVHLVRENLLDCFASNMIAQARNLYHTDAEVVADEPPMTLDPERALHYVLPALRTRAMLREAFRGNPRFIELTYPAFLDSDGVAPAAASKVAAALGLPPDREAALFGPITMRPTAPDKGRLIANYDEVQAHISPALKRLEQPSGGRW